AHGKTDSRWCTTAQLFHKTDITTACTHGALGAETVSHPLEHGTVILIQATHQTHVYGVIDLRAVKQFAQTVMMLASFLGQIITSCRSVVEKRLHFRLF